MDHAVINKLNRRWIIHSIERQKKPSFLNDGELLMLREQTDFLCFNLLNLKPQTISRKTVSQHEKPKTICLNPLAVVSIKIDPFQRCKRISYNGIDLM